MHAHTQCHICTKNIVGGMFPSFQHSLCDVTYSEEMGITLVHHIGSYNGGDNGGIDEGMCLCHQIMIHTKWLMSFQICTQEGRKIPPNTNANDCVDRHIEGLCIIITMFDLLRARPKTWSLFPALHDFYYTSLHSSKNLSQIRGALFACYTEY